MHTMNLAKHWDVIDVYEEPRSASQLHELLTIETRMPLAVTAMGTRFRVGAVLQSPEQEETLAQALTLHGLTWEEELVAAERKSA